MKELDDAIKPILAALPEQYQDVVLRLKTNKDWQAIELVLALVRERILEAGKLTCDGRLFVALDGFDFVFKSLDKIAGTFHSRAKIEKQIFALKKMEGS